MAKAKKTAPASTAGEPAASKPVKKQKSPAKAAAPAQQAAPMIDTNLAAAMAARRLVNRDNIAAAANHPHSESAAFKQMKENLHKPAGQNTPGFLQAPVGGKSFNNSVPGKHQQLGRNQTFGADVNRTGVPRRTGG